MTSHARIFFAGVGTTFIILAIGFGGGVLLATSAVKDNGSAVGRPPQIPQMTVPATRVVHPASSEPVAQVITDTPKPKLPLVQPPDQGVSTPEPSQAQPHEHQKTRRELRAEKRRERAERRAERRARRYHWEPLRQQEPAMMAFGNY